MTHPLSCSSLVERLAGGLDPSYLAGNLIYPCCPSRPFVSCSPQLVCFTSASRSILLDLQFLVSHAASVAEQVAAPITSVYTAHIVSSRDELAAQ